MVRQPVELDHDVAQMARQLAVHGPFVVLVVGRRFECREVRIGVERERVDDDRAALPLALGQWPLGQLDLGAGRLLLQCLERRDHVDRRLDAHRSRLALLFVEVVGLDAAERGPTVLGCVGQKDGSREGPGRVGFSRTGSADEHHGELVGALLDVDLFHEVSFAFSERSVASFSIAVATRSSCPVTPLRSTMISRRSFSV